MKAAVEPEANSTIVDLALAGVGFAAFACGFVFGMVKRGITGCV